MLTGVLTYHRQNQGLTTGGFIQALTDNTTCVIDFKAVFGDFTPSAPDFKTVLTVSTMISRDFGGGATPEERREGGRGIKNV